MMGNIREDLGNAIDELEVGESLEETPQEVLAEPLEGEPVEVDTESPNNETLSGASPSDDDQLKPHSAEVGGAPDPNSLSPDSNKNDEKNAGGENDSLKAPVDWGPKDREQWSKVPRQLQEKILSREKETAEAMAGTAEARKTHQQLNQLAQSYAPVLSAEGVSNPMQAVQSLFHTVSQLRMGTPAQKAQEVARIINDYGIDIATLDNALVGEPTQDPQVNQLDQMLQQKLAPFEEMMRGMQGEQQQRMMQHKQATDNEVKEFAKTAEFLPDVRLQMANLIDTYSKQGQQISLQQAYDVCCQANPEIKAILAERAKNEQIIGNNQSLQQKMNASSSLSGRQIGSGGAGQDLSLRDQIAQAWDGTG